MKNKYVYYIIFIVSFLLFPIVQDYIRPNYDGANEVLIYLLGVAPNFLPGIGLPALLCVVIPELSKPNSSLFKHRLYWSVGISISGLIANEFITIFTPGRGVFDWNDILWTLIGAGFFVLIYKRLNRTTQYFCGAWQGLSQREKIQVNRGLFEVRDYVFVTHLFHTTMKLNYINIVIIEWE